MDKKHSPTKYSAKELVELCSEHPLYFFDKDELDSMIAFRPQITLEVRDGVEDNSSSGLIWANVNIPAAGERLKPPPLRGVRGIGQWNQIVLNDYERRNKAEKTG